MKTPMTTEKAIAMIDEYLLEPNNIAKEWIAVLELCKKTLESAIAIEWISKMTIGEYAAILKRAEGIGSGG